MARLKSYLTGLIAGVAAEVTEYQRAERGILQALEQVNQEGLELSLQEIDYTRLDRERQSKSDLYGLVMQRAAQTDLTRALRLATGRVVDRAVVPTIAVSPRVRLWVVLGAFAGLLLGILTALGIGYVDNKIRSPADLEARGLTLLGLLPSVGEDTSLGHNASVRRRDRRNESRARDLIVHLEPRSTSAECCRTIRTNITFQSADRPLRTLAVSSAMPREGKTTVVINIATTLAQSGKRVLVIDTDLRKPRLHRAFQVPAGIGVTSVLAGEVSFEDAVQTTEVPNVKVLQCGPIPPNPSELLHTRRFSELMDNAKAMFDIVIFDTPPLGAVTDPAIIATQVDGTLLIVRANSTPRAALDASLRQLRGVSARLIGAVLNDVDLSESSYGSYYAYYRGYYEEDSTNANKRQKSTQSA
jgi:capsular exopolysaccharide synthesis family protein